MPFLTARAPVRRGSVLDLARRSRAAVDVESSGDSPAPTLLKREGLGGSIDLMPNCRFGDDPVLT